MFGYILNKGHDAGHVPIGSTERMIGNGDDEIFDAAVRIAFGKGQFYVGIRFIDFRERPFGFLGPILG